MKPVFMLEWTESERGWGMRPDGCSLHLTAEDCKKYVDRYWSNMPAEAPDEYSRPSSEAELVQVKPSLYKKIAASDLGLRLHQYKCDENTKTVSMR